MKAKSLLLALLLAALLLAALLPAAALADTGRTFFAMDTVMTVSAPGADAALLDACEAEIRRLETLFSVTDPDSEIGRLNAEGSARLSEDTRRALDFALQTSALTEGALDVTLYPVVRAWGFTGNDDYRVPGDAEIAGLLARVGWEQVDLQGDLASVPEGVQLDLGSVAKGYAGDRLAELLRAGGVGSALIDLGGNICCVGAKPDGSAWRVGVRDPQSTGGFVGVLAVKDSGVVTSGCYERYFIADDGTRYGHIFDPATGRPADNGVISATVIGAQGLQCDALSTALYVMGVERACALLPRLEGVEALLVDANGELWLTVGLREAFTPMDRYRRAKLHWIE